MIMSDWVILDRLLVRCLIAPNFLSWLLIKIFLFWGHFILGEFFGGIFSSGIFILQAILSAGGSNLRGIFFGHNYFHIVIHRTLQKLYAMEQLHALTSNVIMANNKLTFSKKGNRSAVMKPNYLDFCL